MFRGMNTVSLDAKGRLAMPARYRERLSDEHGGRLVVTIDLDTRHRCLSLYLPGEWEKIERQIDGMSGLNEHVRRMKHLLIGHANDLELDSIGRVLLPQELRRYAGLEKQVCLVGQCKKLEIWSQENWLTKRDEWLEEVHEQGELPEELTNLAL